MQAGELQRAEQGRGADFSRGPKPVGAKLLGVQGPGYLALEGEQTGIRFPLWKRAADINPKG